MQNVQQQLKGPSIKYVTLFLMIFDPLPLVTNCHKSWTPLKVCHTSEQKVNKQISRMETALNNYNRYYYYILNNNKRPYWVFLINHEYPYKFNFLQLRRWWLQPKFVLCMIKYKIKRKIVDCEKWKVWRHMIFTPSPCHKLSHFLRPPPPSGAWHTLWTAPKLWNLSMDGRGRECIVRIFVRCALPASAIHTFHFSLSLYPGMNDGIQGLTSAVSNGDSPSPTIYASCGSSLVQRSCILWPDRSQIVLSCLTDSMEWSATRAARNRWLSVFPE